MKFTKKYDTSPKIEFLKKTSYSVTTFWNTVKSTADNIKIVNKN